MTEVRTTWIGPQKLGIVLILLFLTDILGSYILTLWIMDLILFPDSWIARLSGTFIIAGIFAYVVNYFFYFLESIYGYYRWVYLPEEGVIRFELRHLDTNKLLYHDFKLCDIIFENPPDLYMLSYYENNKKRAIITPELNDRIDEKFSKHIEQVQHENRFGIDDHLTQTTMYSYDEIYVVGRNEILVLKCTELDQENEGPDQPINLYPSANQLEQVPSTYVSTIPGFSPAGD